MTSEQQEGPQSLADLSTPAFVINRHAFAENCRTVLKQVALGGIRLRPHIKTHKTVEGAILQVCANETKNGNGKSTSPLFDENASGFVASTLPEIELLVDAAPTHKGPFLDILYGVGISESKLSRIHTLQTKLSKIDDTGRVHVMVDHPSQVEWMEHFCRNVSKSFQFSAFLKLDTGYHRAGTTCDARGVDVAMKIIQSPHVTLFGLYSHCGHAYDVNTPEDLKDIAVADMKLITGFMDLLRERLEPMHTDFSMETLIVSVGSTPSAFSHGTGSVSVPNLELHPGNYTLYDRQQLWTGVCPSTSHVAGRVLSRVIGHYPDRNTVLLDAGATALTKDGAPQGGVCQITGYEDESSGIVCHKMSQEVVQIKPSTEGGTMPYDQFPLGKLVTLLPNHSCLAAACFDTYYIIDDPSCQFKSDQPIVDQWIPAKGW